MAAMASGRAVSSRREILYLIFSRVRLPVTDGLLERDALISAVPAGGARVTSASAVPFASVVANTDCDCPFCVTVRVTRCGPMPVW